jgi:hypothetical protein
MVPARLLFKNIIDKFVKNSIWAYSKNSGSIISIGYKVQKSDF